MSGSASYSGGATTQNTTTTNTTSYNYNPVAASGGQNFINSGNGKLAVTEGLTATEIQSLAGLGSVFMSHFGTGGVSSLPGSTGGGGYSGGGGVTISPGSSGSPTGSGSITSMLSNPYLLAGLAIAGIAGVYFFMNRGG